MPYGLISSQNIEGKTLVLRLDLNSNIENRKLVVSARLREHAKTVKILSEKGARLVLLAHQGRKGDEDFVSLGKHAKAMAKLSQKPIFFCPWKEDFQKAIKELKQGQVLLLENTRFQDDEATEKTQEEHSKSPWIKKIAAVSDFFVEDALSVCHRPHASVVGFKPLLKCFAGPQLEKEINALQKMDSIASGRLAVLGGAKPDDSIGILSNLFKGKIDKALLGGLPGEVFLKAKGIYLGGKEKFLQEKNYLGLVPKAKQILKENSKKIVLPVDIAFEGKENNREELSIENALPEKSSPYDIGEKTIMLFSEEIKNAKFVVSNGTMGIFEEEGSEKGTREILLAISENKSAFSLIGGGDTLTALDKYCLDYSEFGHVSLAGKALLEYLSGKKLPGLEILASPFLEKKSPGKRNFC